MWFAAEFLVGAEFWFGAEFVVGAEFWVGAEFVFGAEFLVGAEFWFGAEFLVGAEFWVGAEFLFGAEFLVGAEFWVGAEFCLVPNFWLVPNFCCCRIFGWCRIFYNGLFWVPILRCRIFCRICLESFYLWKCQFLCVAKIRQKIRHLKTGSRNSDSEGFKFLDIRGAPDRALGPDPAHEETLRWAWARPGPWPFRVSGRWVYEGPWALARHTRKIDSHAGRSGSLGAGCMRVPGPGPAHEENRLARQAKPEDGVDRTALVCVPASLGIRLPNAFVWLPFFSSNHLCCNSGLECPLCCSDDQDCSLIVQRFVNEKRVNSGEP